MEPGMIGKTMSRPIWAAYCCKDQCLWHVTGRARLGDYEGSCALRIYRLAYLHCTLKSGSRDSSG